MFLDHHPAYKEQRQHFWIQHFCHSAPVCLLAGLLQKRMHFCHFILQIMFLAYECVGKQKKKETKRSFGWDNWPVSMTIWWWHQQHCWCQHTMLLGCPILCSGLSHVIFWTVPCHFSGLPHLAFWTSASCVLHKGHFAKYFSSSAECILCKRDSLMPCLHFMRQIFIYPRPKSWFVLFLS